jgi:beta-lysine 5,6-aminomutase alpha subunit
MTDQSIHLLGMMTEAIHTPHMQDRYLAVKNAEYVMTSIADLADEIEYKTDGIIVTHANQVLDQTIDFLEQLGNIGLFDSIEQGLFAETCRPKDSGKGLDGVMEKAPDYWNPVEEFLKTRLAIAK